MTPEKISITYHLLSLNILLNQKIKVLSRNDELLENIFITNNYSHNMKGEYVSNGEIL